MAGSLTRRSRGATVSLIGVMSKSKAVQTALRKTADALRFDKLHFKLNMRDMQRILVLKPAA
jgi:hypothetical protein